MSTNAALERIRATVESDAALQRNPALQGFLLRELPDEPVFSQTEVEAGLAAVIRFERLQTQKRAERALVEFHRAIRAFQMEATPANTRAHDPGDNERSCQPKAVPSSTRSGGGV